MLNVRKLLAVMALIAPLAQAATPVTLYKSPTCGCCEEYVKYLQANGFDVKAINSDDMNRIKETNHVGNLGSCHTALINGYVVEGHVPVAAIQKAHLVVDPWAALRAAKQPPATTPGARGNRREREAKEKA